MCRFLFALTLLVGAGAQAAPAPAPPRLTDELLAGATWRYEWGELKDGVIVLVTDRTYFATHSPPDGPCYVGTWAVEGERLILSERSYRPETGYVSEYAQRYEVELSTAGCPTLVGRCGRARVVLSDPQR